MSARRACVVTGASSGIGAAIVDALIGGGWRVFGAVRKEKDAEALAAKHGGAFTPLIFDVTDEDAIAAAAAKTRAALEGATLSGLVNNAGVAVLGPLAHLPIDELKRQFDINLFGAVRVTQAFLPLLGADRSLQGAPGRIVNISSVAGRIAAPLSAPYAMSKHALEAFSDTLRRELVIYGVDCVTIGPGAVDTPIWSKADDAAIRPYLDTDYADALNRMQNALQKVGKDGLKPEEIGAAVRETLEAARPPARRALLKNRFMGWTLPNLLPKRMVDRALVKRFGLKAKDET